MEPLRRIALYGGTFDPVHAGHLAVALGLLGLFKLDEVIFVPAHVAPHKRERPVTPPLHRYAMLVLATQEEDALRVSTIELDAPEKPYTVETLARLQNELGQTSRLFFVMGADSWSEVPTWREWERVLLMTDHLIVARPGYDLDSAHISPAVRERLVDLRGREPDEIGSWIEEDDGPKIYVTDVVFKDISATDIRRSVSEGRDAEWVSLVPPPVANYIRKYGLYQDEI